MRFFDQWRQDVRMAARSLGRVPGFTTLAVLTLAIGIGTTTAMFAVVEAVLLRPLPVFDQDRLVVAWKQVPSSGFGHVPFSVEEIDAMRAASSTLESVAGVAYDGAWQWISFENGNASALPGAPVTGDFFGVLGVEPLLGRALTYADDRVGAERVLVIGHDLWQRRYDGSRTVVGRTLQLREQTFRIVGVMPPDFEYPAGAEAWMTIAALQSTFTTARSAPLLDMVGRLRPGATRAQAIAELDANVQRVEARQPGAVLPDQRVVLESYTSVVVGDVRPALVMLFGAVALVLLIASANVANLLLIRGMSRRRELALRTALGAARGRLARQLVAESIVLAFIAGLAGLAFTWWALRILIVLVPQELPRIAGARVDAGVIAFTLTVVLITAAIAGLAPAVSATRGDLVDQLRGAGRGARGVMRRHGHRLLVIAQVALAVMAVAAADYSTVTGIVREVMHTVDPNERITEVSAPTQMLREPMAGPRFNAAIIGIFGIATLLLAAVGLYGVMSGYVRQRNIEIGIRRALGATPRDVRRLVLEEGVRLAVPGAVLGVAGVLATIRVVRGLLYDVHLLDPIAILAAAAALVGVAAVAVYLPARRATRVDPMATLRAD